MRAARLRHGLWSAENKERICYSMEIYEIIGKLLAAFVVGLVVYLVPKARAWFVANTDKTTCSMTRTPPGPSASNLSGSSCPLWVSRSLRPSST